MAVGLPLKTTYANGDVYSASDVNDTNGTVNLLTSSTLSVAAGKNGVINGGFDIWQRGTSISVAGGYTADRWQQYSNAAQTVSRQSSSLTGIQYCGRVQRNNASASTAAIALDNCFESANSYRFAGQIVTLSFYARAGANYSSASSILNIEVSTGTGTDQTILAGYTGSATQSTTKTLTTSWQRFTFTTTALSASLTELGIRYYYIPVGTAGAADFFEVTGVQLELGSVATTFSRAGGTIQGELAACQRYYQRVSAAGASGNYSPMNLTGFVQNSTTAYYQYIPYVPFRSAATSMDFSTLLLRDSSNGNFAISNIVLTDAQPFGITGTITSSGMTGGRWMQVISNNSTAAYVGFSAEL
jgi:hypothetical protein